MSDEIASGRCLCGAVAYTISGNMGIFQYCHCSRCRKFTGSAFAANLFVAPDDFRWTRGDDVVRHRPHQGAKHFATAFCSVCGSSLPWISQSGKTVVVPAGTPDDDPGIRPIQNVFRGSEACWFVDPDALVSHEALPKKKR